MKTVHIFYVFNFWPMLWFQPIMEKLVFKRKVERWGMAIGGFFGRFCFLFFSAKDGMVDLDILNHEKIHSMQQCQIGALRYFWKYYVVERHKTYREKSYEVEAYANMRDHTYIAKTWPDNDIQSHVLSKGSRTDNIRVLLTLALFAFLTFCAGKYVWVEWL